MQLLNESRSELEATKDPTTKQVEYVEGPDTDATGPCRRVDHVVEQVHEAAGIRRGTELGTRERNQGGCIHGGDQAPADSETNWNHLGPLDTAGTM